MDAGFKKADSIVQKHSEQFKKAGKAITAAGAVVTATLGLMVKSYISAGDEVHKMALRTGLSTEALSELKYAADISGTSLATVEKGVKKMASSIGEAKLGLKTYTDAFALIGLQVEELDGLNPEEQFMKMAAGIASIIDPTDRAYAAQKLLGRAGTELLPLFAEGADGLANLRQKAIDMGLSISGPAAQGAADLNDAITTLKGSVSGLTMSIGAQLAPIIEKIAGKVQGFITKMRDWTVEHPKLTKVLVIVVAALGVFSLLLGPLLIMLPGISAGLTLIGVGGAAAGAGAVTGAAGVTIFGVAVKSALGPIALIIGAITGLILITKLIIKNWEPIKKFFANLWNSITGFFVKTFEGIKKKLLDWAIAIVGILAKIPILKKLAGPWKESLQSMRDEMDETVINIDTAAAEIISKSQSIGGAWISAIKGTEQFKNAAAAAKDETSLLGKIFAATGSLMADFGTKSGIVSEIVIKANEEIVNMTKTMVDEIKKATLSDYEYSKWAAEQKYLDRIASITNQLVAEQASDEQIKALEVEKFEALKLLNESYRLEQEQLDQEHKEKEIARSDEQLAELAEKRATYEAKIKEQLEKYVSLKADITDKIKKLTLSELDYTLWTIDQESAKKADEIDKTIKDENKKVELLKLLDKKYAEEKEKVISASAEAIQKKEEETAAAAAKAWKASLENTLGDVGRILGMIGSLFQQSLNLKLDLIDKEEREKLDSIDLQYNAQIEAVNKLLSAEEEKTRKIIENINKEYDEKKKWIEENITDEEERSKALADLETARAEELQSARDDRKEAVESLIETLMKLEEGRIEAARIASEDLEEKRSAARRKAAKQEKAVALLSAIVSTAAAIAKALPNIPLAIAVGILGAIQIAIIAATPLPMGKGGIVTKSTIIEAGEAGPEAIIPLKKLMPMMGGEVKITFYNTWNVPKEVALSPRELEAMFQRNENEMTRKIKSYLGRY